VKYGDGPVKEFRRLFDNVVEQNGHFTAETRTNNIMGKCIAALGRDASGWYIEAWQNMGWTDFDAAREGLLAAAGKYGATLMTPGPDGISQPVLRVRIPITDDTASAWGKVTAVLAAMDDYLRQNG